MAVEIIREEIGKEQLHTIASEYYEDLIKGVADTKRGIIALGGEMHVDAEEVLLENGSDQSDLWGFNILLDADKEDCLVYESFINIRPRDGNAALEVQSPDIRNQMKEIIFKWVKL